MPIDDATLIFGLKDEVSQGVNRILVALEKYNTATKQSDKNTVALEKSLANVQAKLATVATQGTATASAFASMDAAAAKYRATIKSIGDIKFNSAGQLVNGKGQFASASDVNKVLQAENALNAIQAQRSALIAEQTTQMKAALPVGSARYAQLVAERNATVALNAEQAKRAASVNPFGLASASTVSSRLAFQDALGSAGGGALAAEADKGSSALKQLTDHAIATRYALFSLSQTLFQVGTVLVALPVASALVAASFERDFATVERASLVAGKQAAALKQSLLNLSETVPVTFKNLTNIAAAGSQLGIAPSGLVNFTRVVAELTATTNLSAEAAENFLGKFAKIAKVPQNQFTNLASSILNVGVHTAATESQIAKLSTQIVGIGREAGFTVPQIVGISGALASVSSVGAELARGTVTRFVTDIQKAVSSGGPALDAFAKTAGTTGLAVQHAFGTGAFMGVFVNFIKGLDKVQESGGNANAILAQIGVTSVRDVPLLLNLAAGNQVLTDSLKFAADGFANADILAVHYSKINDTLVSKVKELGNSFAVMLNSVGSASTGPLKDLVAFLTDAVKGLDSLAHTSSGQTFLVIAASTMVLVGALALAGSALAKIVGGFLAAGTVYSKATEAVTLFTAAQEAAAAQSVSGVTKFSAFASFLSNPYVLAVGAAVVALTILSAQLEKTKASAEEIQNVLATSGSFGKISAKITQGGGGGNLFADLSGADVAAKFKDFNNSIKKQANLTGGDLWHQIVAGFGQGSLKEAQSMQLFGERLKETGQNLATLAQTNLPAAQNGFAVLAQKTDGSKTQLKNLLNEMGPYKDELTRQLTVAGVAVNTNELLKLAYGGVGAGALDTAGKAKVLTDEIAKQRDFQSQLSDKTGLAQKDINDYGQAYQKSIQPLTDFNSIVGQVQKTLTDAANAEAAAHKGKKASDYYDGVSVSLAQFTSQLNVNNAAQEKWFTNLITVATKYGNDAAQIFISAGYTATNNSLLQQLVNATPAQAKAYIDAQTRAANDAAAATGAALISAGVLVTSAGTTIGKDTAAQMGKMLLAGFSPEQIMAKFNLKFAASPAVPRVDTGPAKGELTAFYNEYQHNPLILQAYLRLNTAAASTTLANVRTGSPNARIFATGGYTGDGSKFQPAGIVHAGEFVFTKEATSRIGVDKLYALMRDSRNSHAMARPFGYASGGAVGGFATLDAATMQAFLAMAERPIVLYTTDKVLATSVNNGNAAIAYGGGR